METTLFYRDGRPFTGTPKIEGRTFFIIESVTCGRCGGSGHYSYCQMWGTVCFECKGAKRVAEKFKLYPADKLAKMNATKAKHDDAKAVKAQADAAAREAKQAENAAKFNTENAALLADLATVTNPTVLDIIGKGRIYGMVTEPQMSVLVNAVAAAKRHAEAQAASSYVGVIGDKVSVPVTVTHVGSYERTPYQRSYYSNAMETVYVVTMTDAAGNVFVTKTPNFNEPKGESFILSGTVKAHDEYKSVKQTIITRAKRKEIPTGVAAGFRKITE